MHGCSDLVAHVGQKVVLQFGALPVRGNQLQLGLSPLRQVAGELAEADVDVILVDDRDDHVGPESATILAVAPALIFHPALAQADLEFSLRLPGLDIILAV